MKERLRIYWRFTRPFTLLPPLLGMVSGSVAALGALAHRRNVSFFALDELRNGQTWILVAWGAVLAAVLNAGSNILNQWTDLENDRINKPHRPLPLGQVNRVETWTLVVLFYGMALACSWIIRPTGQLETFWIVLGGVLLTLAYSVPPIRTKRFGTLANLTIALARGCLLKVAGWSCVAAVFSDPEPWYVGSIFALFLMGAASTKDFADMEGDRAAGCITWPVRFGPRIAIRIAAPFFVIPWLFIPLGVVLPSGVDSSRPMLTGDPMGLLILGVSLALYGGYVIRLMLRQPEALTHSENHPSWRHMYFLMMLAQVGLVIAYVL